MVKKNLKSYTQFLVVLIKISRKIKTNRMSRLMTSGESNRHFHWPWKLNKLKLIIIHSELYPKIGKIKGKYTQRYDDHCFIIHKSPLLRLFLNL